MRAENMIAIIDVLYAYAEAARNDTITITNDIVADDMQTLAEILSSDESHEYNDIFDSLHINEAYEWA